MRRLRASAAHDRAAVPLTDAEIGARIRETMRGGAACRAEAYIRMLVTRGVGELTYDPAACPAPSIVIIVKPHVEPPPASVYERRREGRARRRSSATTPARSTR